MIRNSFTYFSMIRHHSPESGNFLYVFVPHGFYGVALASAQYHRHTFLIFCAFDIFRAV